MKRRVEGSLVRPIAIISALLLMLVGVTYALFQSNTTIIQGSTISSATARLLISDNDIRYSDAVPGFLFAGVEPGGAAAPAAGKDIYFKNDGTSPLNLGVNLSNSLRNSQNVELNRVYLVITDPTDGRIQRISLASMFDHYNSGTYVSLEQQLQPNQVGHYRLQVSMDADAVTSAQTAVTLNDVDILFAGTSPSS